MALLGDVALALAAGESQMGLRWEGVRPCVEPAFFSCCGGNGSPMDFSGDVHACDLRRRLIALESLRARFHQVWGSEANFPPCRLSEEERRHVLVALDDWRQGRDRRGICLTHDLAQAPGPLWEVALLSIWRFGIDAHIATFERQGVHEILPSWARSSHAAGRGTGILLLEGVDKPWQADHAEALDLALTCAVNGNFPFFVSVPPAPRAPANSSKGGLSREQFQRRTRQHRQRPWAEHLSEWARARLEIATRERFQKSV
jgi:hypothetical protein